MTTAIPANLVQSNGITQVSDGNLNTYAQWTTNLASLRAFIGIGGMTTYLQGLTAAGDGGQGTFYWNGNTGQTDNGLTTIIPYGSASGAWNRLTSPVVNSYSLQIPVTGFSITAPNYVNTLILNPASTLATGTIVMPAAFFDGQLFIITTSQTITALTITPNTGQTVLGTVTTLTSTSPAKWIYQLSNLTWYRQ